jgi:hypothetical protein
MKRFLSLSIGLVFLVVTAAAWADGTIVSSEHIGKLRLGMKSSEVVAAVGHPNRRSGNSKSSDGAIWQLWEYRKLGMILLMTSPRKGAEQTLSSITIQAPSKLSTARQIAVGSSEEDVRKAYGAEIDRENSGAEMIVAGTLKGGLVFTTSRGKVVRIFLGALQK